MNPSLWLCEVHFYSEHHTYVQQNSNLCTLRKQTCKFRLCTIRTEKDSLQIKWCYNFRYCLVSEIYEWRYHSLGRLSCCDTERYQMSLKWYSIFCLFFEVMRLLLIKDKRTLSSQDTTVFVVEFTVEIGNLQAGINQERSQRTRAAFHTKST